MNDKYREQVEAAIQATVIRSPVAFSWRGLPSEPLPRAVRRALPPPVARDYLLSSLRSRLYEDFYSKGFTAPAEPDRTASPRLSDASFVAVLAAANRGKGCRALGWTVESREGEQIVVHKGGLSLWVERRHCQPGGEESLSPGMPVTLHLPTALPERSPGFFTVLGETGNASDGNVVRLYWNLTADGAAEFVKVVTARLNEARVPFQMKIVSHPARFTRCDAAVLYVPRSNFHAVAGTLTMIYRGMARFLKPATPAFTKELAPGFGLAEDPNNGESFGWHRCRLLADGMIRAHETGRKAQAERVETVEQRFVEDGLSLASPYLNPGSHDVYRVATPAISSGRRPARQTGRGVSCDDAAFLEAAIRIGKRLASEAVWANGQCNWVGAAPAVRRPRNGQPGLTYSALGPDLYSGTSGVALFFGEVHRACGDAEMRRVTLGAIRNALARAETLRPHERFGLYTGWTGIALVAARIGTLLKNGELLERAGELASKASSGWPEERDFDLLAGDAGTIAGLLALGAMLPEGRAALVDASNRLGEELVRKAVKTEAGYSWRSPVLRSPRNLTGLSHGAAGAAYALVELFAATGESKYREAATQAFAYERHWFDAAARNWPDFRQVASQAGTARPHRFAVAWCHGAPGIALSRLRAYELTQDEACKAEAVVGLDTTRRALEESLRYHTGNWSLCHGFAGNAEVLLHAERVLGSQPTDWKATACAVAAEGLRRHARSGHHWPCGGGGGQTPGLMLGLAGIGYFYLRLHSPHVSSVLLCPPTQGHAGDTWGCEAPKEDILAGERAHTSIPEASAPR